MKRPSFCRRTWKLTKCVLGRPPKIQPKAEDSTTTNKQTMDHGLSLLIYLSTVLWILTMSLYHLISLWRCILKNQDPTFKWHKKDWLLHLCVKVCVHKQSCRWHPQGKLIQSVILACKFPSEFAQFGSSGLLSIIHKLSLCTLDASGWFFEENAFIKTGAAPTFQTESWPWQQLENTKLILTIYDGLMLLKLQKQTATTTTTTTPLEAQ